MKTARIIRDREGQAVRLPEEFQFPGRQVLIKRMGIAVILLPKGATWGEHLQSLPFVSPDFMKDRARSKRQSRARIK
jgi:virulence-associated protein VagC